MNAVAIVKSLLENDEFDPKDYVDQKLKDQSWTWHTTRGTEYWIKDWRTKRVVGYVQQNSQSNQWYARIVCNEGGGCTGTGHVDFATREEAAEFLWRRWLDKQST